ncbi:MAG: glycosylhydrolase-like jelly roll fold domain-containing protein [Nitrospinales bacterium]
MNFSNAEARQDIEFDLGEVYVAAKVFVNGKPAGIKVAAPYKFDLSGMVQSGENEIEVRVANTLAPLYSIPKKARD